MKINKDQITFYSILLFLIILIFYIINIFSYFNPIRLCYISITGDPISGNEAAIKSAIRLLKKEDKRAYHITCQYVDRINEKYCMGADPRGGQDGYIGQDEAGCYIKGSEVIYIKPAKDNSEISIKNRAEAIKKYSNLSKDFWENYNN